MDANMSAFYIGLMKNQYHKWPEDLNVTEVDFPDMSMEEPDLPSGKYLCSVFDILT